jgi:two-component system, chemotaxis family, protein-glutamate methylesterase/glutaminase
MAFEIVAIGASWGGMRAIGMILEALPETFPPAIVVVQHRGPSHDDELLEKVLGRHSRLEVVAVTDKEPIRPGHVYVAPAGYHLIVEPGHLALDSEEIVQFSRPSIDVLFESVAAVYGDRALAVLLTGRNEDGAEGLERIVAAGGFAVVQDPDTAEQGEMPAAAIARGAAHRVLQLEEIGPFLAALRPALSSGGGE